MIVVVFVAFFGAHATGFFANHEIFFRNFRVSLQKSRGLQADVGTVAVEFDAAGEQGDVLFVQTRGLAFFAGQRALN
jgi:hypothetical protein